MTPQGAPKWSKSQYSHHNIAIFTSCPKSPKWCHMVPKGLQNESLGSAKCSKVEPSGPQRDPRGAQSAPKCAKRSPWEAPWNASWAQSGPSALQGSIFEWILSDFEVHFSGILLGCFLCFWLVLAWLAAKAQQKMSNPCTSKSRNLELHFTMSVFLLAASLNFQLYWRALPSFPVLANTGSGKLWLAQKLKVCFT